MNGRQAAKRENENTGGKSKARRQASRQEGWYSLRLSKCELCQGRMRVEQQQEEEEEAVE